MTREEAIQVLAEDHKQRVDGYTSYIAHYGHTDPSEEKYLEATEMGISALREQEERSKAVLTNADRIRAMSDEELARFLTWNVPDCANYCVDARCGCKWNCKHGDGLKVIREWLQQSAKEDA